jgi:hypothetical protein
MAVDVEEEEGYDKEVPIEAEFAERCDDALTRPYLVAPTKCNRSA